MEEAREKLQPADRALFESGLLALKTGVDSFLRDPEFAEADVFPAFDYLTGRYRAAPEYYPDAWHSYQWIGFLCGRLWVLASHYDEPSYAALAKSLALRIGTTLTSREVIYGDNGFDTFYALSLGYNLTGDDALRDLALRANNGLVNGCWQPRFSSFVQHATDVTTVIDMPAAFQSLYWGAEPAHVAIMNEANDAIKGHGYIRADCSTYHSVEFDPATGAVRRRFTRQGYADGSTWTRGQSWAINNFCNAYATTGDEKYLHTASQLADFYISRLPEDCVPHYDLDDPDVPEVPLDTCSAAQTASNLQRLEKWIPERASDYHRVWQRALTSLVREHVTTCGTLLHGSWGRVRRSHGIGRFPQEDIMPYGNYWIAEALSRAVTSDWSLFDATLATA